MGASQRPNVVFLQTDQHRWDALGCVNPLVKTPNLDALAARGVRFDQAVCNAPICVPSRYSMMLGLYPSQSGLRHNTQIVPDDSLLPLPVLPRRMRELGYQTAGFGKTHWYEGEPFFPKDAPIRRSARGFEVRAVPTRAQMEPGAMCMEEENPEMASKLMKEKKGYGGGGEDTSGYVGRTSEVPWEWHHEGWYTRKAMEFLEKGRDHSRPLFLYLSFNYPHPGFGVPKGFEDLYDIKKVPDRLLPPWAEEPAGHVPPPRWRSDWEKMPPEERRRTTLRYWALVSCCDDLLGRLLGRYMQTEDMDNTLVIFTADHGEMLGDRRHRFSKYCLYEGAVRVPLMVAGAGVPAAKRGTVDHRCAELADILPTVMRVAGEKPPIVLPGLDLLGERLREGGFCEYHGSGYEKEQAGPAWMWRTPEWKLILFARGKLKDLAGRAGELNGELYDLRNDPQEWKNLFDAPGQAARRAEMTAALLAHLGTAAARFPRHIEGKGWTSD